MKNLFYFLFVLGSITLISCDDDEGSASMLNLNINGLENLGPGYAYEGWLIVNGNPVTTGVFTINDNGVLSKNFFDVAETTLNDATTFVLTIEPSPDNDPAPSDVHILAGDFNNNSASLTIGHSAALNNNFSTVAGTYILATPTNGSNNDENSGIWFLDPTSGSPVAGLTLPTLPAGWIYEGWAVINGTPVSTGTFSSASGLDNDDSFSGSMPGPAYPGEDFLVNAPAGLSFPTDLAGGKAVISIEPVPDNSTNPFLLKPLAGDIPVNAVDHTPYQMAASTTYPTGTATK